MKTLSKDKALGWLNDPNFNPRAGTFLEGFNGGCFSCIIPKDSGHKTALAKLLVRHLTKFGDDSLFWINEYGIWPSAELPLIFERYRHARGISASLREAPAHLFCGNDLDDIECMLALALYFVWGFILVDSSGTFAVRADHDEFLSIHANTAEKLEAFRAKVTEFGLQLR